LQQLIYISLLFCVLFPLESQAQLKKKEVYGFVVDVEGIPMKGVNVRLTSSVDTMLLSTSKTGYYMFREVRGINIKVTYSMLGYQILEKSYPAYDQAEKIQVPAVVLRQQSSLLKEILISKVAPIVFKEDTIQYNMAAYTFRPRSLVEDALKQLPNIQVSRDGSVYAYGKQISFVQVDGKKFFGGDVLTATRNLPIDFVSNIQIIDSYGDYAGAKGTVGGAPSEKIINIVLKEDKKKITFGQATAGVGSKDRYLGSVGLNKFNDGQELSVLGSINNTNTSLFTFGAPSGGERERSSGELSDFADPTDGYNKITSFGASFSDNITDKTSISGRYTFLNKKNTTIGNSFLQSVYVNSSIFNWDEYKISTNEQSHIMNWQIESKFNQRDVLKISPKISYSRSDIINNRDKRIKNRTMTTEGNYLSDGRAETPNMGIDVFYVKYFKKEGRKFVSNLSAGFNDITKSERITDRNRWIDSSGQKPVITQTLIDQDIRNRNTNKQAKFSASFIEPTDYKGILEVNYDYEINQINSNRSVNDMVMEPELMRAIDSLGVRYNYIYSANRVGINYQIETIPKLKFNLGFAVQPMTLSGRTFDHLIKTSYDNVNLVPTLGLRWRINNDTDLSVDYIGKNNQPSFYQIQPILDNSNSQYIVIGNPDIKAEFANRISTKFRKSIVSKGQYFEADLALNLVKDKIVTEKTVMSNSTIQQTTFTNTSGYYDIKSYYLFNSPFFSDYLQLNLTGNFNYYNNVSFVNARKNYGNLLMYSQSVQLRYMFDDYFETELNGNYTLNYASYDWPFSNKVTAESYVLSWAGKGYLGNQWTVGMEVSQRFNKGYTYSGMNINPTIINAYVEYTFLANNRAMLRLQGFDLMNQNTGISREVIGNEILDIQNNRLSRYFMMSLNIRLQKYPKK